jgi:group I intron endonuclease
MTSKDLNYRLRKHLSDKGNWLKRIWIKELKILGLNPLIEEIDIVPFETWEYWESWYIELFRYYGFNIFNLTNGGEGTFGYKHTNETKRKIREKRKIQVFSKETCENLSKVRMNNTNAKGKKHSDKMRIDKSISQRGKFGGSIIRTDELGNIVEFASISDAGDSIKTSYKNIWYACEKRLGFLYKGFYWEYKDKRQIKNNDLITKEYLYQKYIVERISGKKIGIELNCSQNKIYRLIKIYNL